MTQFDVVVVGARCAGSPLAAMLAGRGLRVCVVDRARFPSETPSTHIIQSCGTRVLDRLGVLDAVLTAGAVPLDRMTMVIDDAVRIEGTVERANNPHPSLCVRRVTLDALLVDAAAAAGADVRTGVRVKSLITEGGRVTGVNTTSGPIQARLVVGADGRHSTVAALIGAREYHVASPGKAFAWGYFEQVRDRDGHARLARRGDLGFLASPTDGDLYMAAIGIDMAKQAEFHANREANFAAGIRAWPELADVLAGGRRVGPIRVLTNWHGYFREAAGPGWVLVGDAGHFKDPTPGQGIGDAFRQARRLAHAIEDGLGNTEPDDAMQRWWRWRDDDAYEMHWLANDFGAPGAATPLTTRLMRDVAADPDATQRFFGVLNRDVRPSQLFTTPMVARAAARALRDRPDRMIATFKEIVHAGWQTARRSRQRPINPQAGGVAGPAVSATARPDDDAIRNLVDRQAMAWAAGDPEAYASVFTHDADYVTFLGSHHKGRAAIAASYAPLFKKLLAGSRLDFEITQLRYLTPDVALIHARVAVTKGARRRTQRRTRVNTSIAVRTDGGWRLAASQNTTHRRFAEKLMSQIARMS
jgi:menaquinone-9 beta-reductase